MTLTAVLASLQMAASLLTGLVGNIHASQADIQQAITLANQTVQQAVQLQTMPLINFPTPKNDSIWPNITDLYNAAYISAMGGYSPNGGSVGIVGEDTSFGDLNADGLDDAAVIVARINSSGSTIFSLAAMLNQNGGMFNIADVDLGSHVQVFSHHIIGGGVISLDMQIDNQPRATYQYQLLGHQLIKI